MVYLDYMLIYEMLQLARMERFEKIAKRFKIKEEKKWTSLRNFRKKRLN